jgi:pyruvate,water dikinase
MTVTADPMDAALRPDEVREGSPAVVGLDDPAAEKSSLSGAKAANLARARAAGLPVLPGFVLTTAAPRVATSRSTFEATTHAAWNELSQGGRLGLVVRSSSTIEDTSASSMAGRFVSKVGIVGWEPFVQAVDEVQASSERVVAATGPAGMAVLVQPALTTPIGGVLFGVDPVTGDSRRVVVEATSGGPKALVDGTAAGEHLVLSKHGHRQRARGQRMLLLERKTCRELARLSRRVDRLFDSPQDVEWGIDTAGRLWLLQSRPVTATSDQPAKDSVLLGPGPVGETLPDSLSPLETDLWVEPLRVAVVNALRLTRSAPERRIASSPQVTVVSGRVACDLELLGVVPGRRPVVALLSPRRGFRHLVSAWRVGRLRAMLPELVHDLVATADDELRSIGPLDSYDGQELVQILSRAREWLVALHGHQVLSGMVLPPGGSSTAAGIALQAVSAGRARGKTDSQLIEQQPIVLALSAPRIGPPKPVHPQRTDPSPSADEPDLSVLDAREELRLRARWVQELTARAAWCLGRRLTASGRLERAEDVRLLRLDELAAVVDGLPVPPDLGQRAQVAASAPLPAAFRLSPRGDIVPARLMARHSGPAGLPVGGGRGVGRVLEAQEDGSTGPGVLVVTTLDPALAPALPGLAGLVSETGGALSHLAILAREQHLPVVVGVTDAVRRFPPGTLLLVDGDVGDVVELCEEGDDR